MKVTSSAYASLVGLADAQGVSLSRALELMLVMAEHDVERAAASTKAQLELRLG